MRETAMLGVAGVPAVGSSPTECWALRLALALSLGGAGVAGYLVHLHGRIAGNPKRGLCTFTDTISCDVVLASPYAAIGPIPVALVGVLGFVVLAALAAWRLRLGQHGPRWLPAVLALTAGCGLAFELVMTWVELFIIEAVCPYCLTALGFIAATFIASLVVWHAARRRVTEEIRHA